MSRRAWFHIVVGPVSIVSLLAWWASIRMLYRSYTIISTNKGGVPGGGYEDFAQDYILLIRHGWLTVSGFPHPGSTLVDYWSLPLIVPAVLLALLPAFHLRLIARKRSIALPGFPVDMRSKKNV